MHNFPKLSFIDAACMTGWLDPWWRYNVQMCHGGSRQKVSLTDLVYELNIKFIGHFRMVFVYPSMEQSTFGGGRALLSFWFFFTSMKATCTCMLFFSFLNTVAWFYRGLHITVPYDFVFQWCDGISVCSWFMYIHALLSANVCDRQCIKYQELLRPILGLEMGFSHSH